MKPKNKLQRQVVTLSKKLPQITDIQKAWAYKHCIEHICRRSKKNEILCLECGYKWNTEPKNKKCTCPSCGEKLVIQDTRKRIFKEIETYCIITAKDGMQVLRFFEIKAYFKAGEKAQYTCHEIVQQWITPNGEHETLALLRCPSFFYCDLWNYSSSLEIRSKKPTYSSYYYDIYNIIPKKIYPIRKYIPEIKRNGFRGNFHAYKPLDFFTLILKDSRAETLLKAGQYVMFRHLPYLRSIESLWASIKICIRNNYIIPNATTWKDYIDLLKFFGKDMLNPKYVCPANLEQEHDKLMQKKVALEVSKNIKELAKGYNLSYQIEKQRFLDLVFTDGLINITVLQNVEEFYEEGNLLHHCVYSNGYYKKSESLILSARIGSRRIETIEVSLANLNIVQCQGNCNKLTEHHDKIMKLIKQNIFEIGKRIAA